MLKPLCERTADPLGVDVAKPKLFWQVHGNDRGERQSAYQILVASRPELLAQEKGDLWDSGRIESDQTTFVAYGGEPPASSQRVYWSVRAWDREGRPSAWSEPATWTNGLLSPADWKGTWIRAATPGQSVLLRREFGVRPGLTRAVAHVSGLGQYELNCNGGKVGHDLLTPGWTDYRKTILYDTYDLTDRLKAGPNVLGLTLANGTYKVERTSERFAKFTGSFGEQRAIVHLRLEYGDGTTEFDGSDAHWKAHPGPVTFASIYGGEDYDARRSPAGWDVPGFDDKDWTAAVDAGAADDKLRGLTRAAEPVREIEARKPVDVKAFADGSSVYDFGQNASFMPRLRVSGPAGSTVRLTPAETVMPDGAIYRGTTGGASRGSAWWQYTKSTDGPEEWSPQFYYVGGRYVHAELVPPGQSPTPPNVRGIYPFEPKAAAPTTRPSIESIEADVVHSTAAPAGEFETSDAMVNRIRTLIRWAQRSNLMSIITDCPHREKLGWLEQLNMNGPSLRYEFDAGRLFAKAEADMADAQQDDGLVPNIAPEYTVFRGTFRAAAEWGASFISVPWHQYLFDGDVGLMRQHYDAMKRYYAYLESKADGEGILSEGLGDWYDLGKSKPGKAQLTPPPVTATAFLYEDAVTLSRIAKVLGHNEDAASFAAKAEKVKADYLKKFFHADTGTFATNSQCSNALPLAMGMMSDADRPRVLDALLKTVEDNGYGQTTADVGFRYLLRALADSGRSDAAFKVITQDGKPGYAKQVNGGETTLTESWDANRTSSHNHFMLGHATEWFYRGLVGIAPDADGPGFKKFIVKPNLVGDVTFAEAKHTSLNGEVGVRWERGGDKLVLRLTVPTNTTATVYLPSKQGTPVLEGGKPIENVVGVKLTGRDGDYAVLAVESGEYAFESTR